MEMVSQLTEYHDLSPSEVTQEHYAVKKIKSTILGHGNPFAVLYPLECLCNMNNGIDILFCGHHSSWFVVDLKC